MTYSKPEVTKLANSIEVIQGGEKEKNALTDSPTFQIATVPAYEADE
jgi:hypothetical protein